MLKSFSVSAGNFLRSFSVKATSVVTLALLSGCLVHSNGGKTFFRETDSIHLYQPGDFIEYSVSGTFGTGISAFHSVSGTLRIDWSSPNNPLLDPVTGSPVDVLKEISTLSVDGGEIKTVRYISQDADGTVHLHAYDKDSTHSYWVNDAKSASTTAAMNPVTLLQSPLVVSGISYSNTFYLFDDCNYPGGCPTYLGYQAETDKVESNNENVQTDPGVFNTFRVSFSGSKFVDPSSGISAFPIELDPRSSCGIGNDNFSGTANFFPQVGVVAMYVSCISTAGPYFYYTFSFKHAGGSIVLPSPT